MVRAAQASPTTVPAPGVQSLARALSGQSVSLARALALTIYLYTHAFIRTTIHTVASLASPRTARIASHASPRKPSQRLSTPNAARLASLASPRLPSHHIASHRSIASPCLQRLACIASLSLASPRSPCLDRHRLGFARLPRLALLASPPCSPRLARLASPESLALPRLARLASLASPLARSSLASALAFLVRRACFLASATAPLATGGLAASDVPPSKSAAGQLAAIELSVVAFLGVPSVVPSNAGI